MSLFGFIKSKDFRKTLLRAVITAAIIVLCTWVFLRFYTKHGEQVLVPNVENMSLNEAINTLKKHNLCYKLIDSTYVKGKSDLIYAQIPEDSSFVKSEREIYLKVYRTIPPQKPVRFKVGEPLEIAKTKLLSKGFEIETKYQAGEFDNVILGAYHSGEELVDGDMVGMGEKIKLIVSEKKTTKVNLPSLFGLTLEEAKIKLAEASLNLDFPLYDETVLTKSDSVTAKVYRQLPKYSEGMKIRAGSTINVWLNNKVEGPDPVDLGSVLLDD